MNDDATTHVWYSIYYSTCRFIVLLVVLSVTTVYNSEKANFRPIPPRVKQFRTTHCIDGVLFRLSVLLDVVNVLFVISI